jgi:hypothetical protein
MTDFVDRLLGMSDLPAIRPLLPTLFEPLRRGDADTPLPIGVFTDTPRGADAGPAPDRGPEAQTQAPPMSLPEPLGASVRADDPAPVVHMKSYHSETHHHHPGAAASAPRSDPPPPTVAISLPSEHAVVQSLPAVSGEHTRHDSSPGHRRTSRREHVREPDVHISIGRVEIKATQGKSAANPRQQADKRPQLTLDEYLRGRGADR